MSPTIYAAFDDAGEAERAAGALIDHGVKPEHISLVVSEEYTKRQGTPDDPELDFTHPQTVSRMHSASNTLDPLGNQMRDTPITIDPAYNRHDLGPGNELRGDLNPAQDDYPRSSPDEPTPATELSSVPPNATRDYNPGLEGDNYNKHYHNDVGRENRVEAERDLDRRLPENLSEEGDQGLGMERSPLREDARDEDGTADAQGYDPERAAKMGLTTTTIEDAASAAKKGAVLGLGVGSLAAIAAIAIPGFGLVLGGGALAVAAAGLAASAGAGAVAGGVVGFLKDQGVPADHIPAYQKAYEGGGAILQIHGEGMEQAHLEEILRKYGATSVNDYGYAA